MHNELNTYGPVSINSIDQQPALSVSGQAMMDNLIVGTVDAQNIFSSGGSLNVNTLTANTIIDNGAAGNVGQVFIVGAGGKLSPSTFTPSGVSSVNAGTGITITGTASNPIVNLATPVSVADGGTGNTSLTAHNVLIGQNTANIALVAPGIAGTALVSNGPASDPSFGLVTVPGGGTGQMTFPAHALLIGEGTASLANTGAGTAGQLIISGGASADPSFVTPSVGTGLTLINNASTLQYELTVPVSIAHGGTNATSMTTTDGVVYYDGVKLVTTSTGTSGQVLTSQGGLGAPTWTTPTTGTVTSVTTGSNGLYVSNGLTTTTPILDISPSGSFTTGSVTITGNETVGGTAHITGNTTLAGNLALTSPTSTTTIASLPTGVVHSTSGTLSSSLIKLSDISPTLYSSSDTPNTLVLRDGSGNFSANIITASLNGAASANVLKTGDTMTGTLQLPAGTSAAPSLVFTGSTTSGLSASAGALSFNTNGTERMKISSAGTVSIDTFTTPGVVHNDGSGNLSTSLIVNADISNTAAITDTKLATISSSGKVANSATTATSANTPSTIVLRDSLGDFAATTITANLIGNVTGLASGNLPLTGGTLTGNLTLPAGSPAAPSLQFSGSSNTGLSAPTANSLSLSVNGTQAIGINTSGQVTVRTLSPAGVVHSSSNGTLSSSLIVDADITNATISNSKLASISSSNTPGSIVVRDGSGNFATNMITINGTTTVATDVATKSYVDSVTSTGIVPHSPARVVSTSNVATSGLFTIDGVSLLANDRSLLVGQTSPTQNGLWLAESGAWIRPTDFANGTKAGPAYVLVTEGTVNAGSSWLCSTPTAIIGTSPISFIQFSLPNQTNGVNVGSGTGQIFQSKSGNNLNFRTIAGGSHLTVSTSPTVVSITTDATSTNTASTIVSRDASGNFSAGTITANNLTVTANETVGGTLGVTGATTLNNTLDITGQHELRLYDATTTNYVGINAPISVGTNYTLSLPATPPTANQILVGSPSTPTHLQWTNQSGSTSPAISRTIYVTKYGNDSTGTGSFSSPYATLSKAITVANTLATLSNPLTIAVDSGVYIENNGSGPLTITAEGISLVGLSIDSTFIVPTTLSNDLISATATTLMSDLTFNSGGASTAAGITFSGANNNTLLLNLRLLNFGTAISCSGTNGLYVFNLCGLIGNGIGININNTTASCNNCLIQGSATGTPANTGVSVTGSSALVGFIGVIENCSTGALITNSADFNPRATGFRNNTIDISQNSSSKSQISGCTFQVNQPSDIDIQVNGAGTTATVIGCYFNGNDALGVPQGTAVAVTGQGSAKISSCEITNYSTALQVGAIDNSDTASTSLNASAVTILASTTHDIAQYGTSTLVFTAGSANDNLFSINNSINTTVAVFDNDSNNALSIGHLSDTNTVLIKANTGSITDNDPEIDYKISLYSTKGIGYQNITGSPASLFALSTNNTNLTAITTDRTKTAGIRLVSDTVSPTGGTSALRGWDITKNSNTAELSFRYQNSDVAGQSVIPEYTVMQLDGVNNQLQLPNTATKIVLGGDTNLYRGASNTLKTDGNLVVGGSLTANPLTAHAVLIGEGTNPITAVGPGTAGQTLVSGGALADPSFVTPTAGVGLTVTSNATTLQYALSTPVSVTHGGTGATTLTGVLIGNGTSAVTGNPVTQFDVLVGGSGNTINSIMPSATTGIPLISNGLAANPSFGTAVVSGGGTGATSFNANSLILSGSTGTSPLTSLNLANGQLAIGSTGAAPLAANITAGSGISVTNGAGTITIATSSAVPTTFTENAGTATPSANNINILGSPTQGIMTTGTGSTVNVTGINASTVQKGVASFNPTQFSATSGAISSNNFTITASTGLTGGGSLTLGGSTSLALSVPVSVANGGTGDTSLKTHNVLLGEGTAPVSFASPTTTTGIPLVSTGNTTDPIFGTASVAGGGTGRTSFSSPNGVLFYDGSRLSATSVGTAGQVLTSNGAGSAPTYQSVSASGAVNRLNGDTGFATPTTGVITFNANTNAGATVKFSGSASTMNLLVTSPTTFNTFIGLSAGSPSATGTNNTALGYQALDALTTGAANTGIGYQALTSNTTGANNIAIGYQAGSGITTGTNNIHIGISIPGANESNTIRIGTQGTQTGCYIGGIYGVAHSGGSVPVQATSDGHITGQTSSRRYKENISPLTSVSEQLTQLKPVTFTYKIDAGKYPQYGLIAEDVHEIYPEWIFYNKEGEIESVNYTSLTSTLLKGWQEQQQHIEELYARIITLESTLSNLLQK
ncbi:MAG: tail fiber domain-containing protein [Candidatus Dependentiae bacterium]|nr:tail fiber domain-containing protein [Candidatus Dependentiae bacterium]